jgi:hypothetical protein
MTSVDLTSTGGSPDFTKTRWYAILDICGKLLTALAIAALGLLGYCFQRSTERSKDGIAIHEKEEMRYLPALQGLAELQLALNTTSDRVSVRTGTTILDDVEMQRMGTRIAYLADSMYFPDVPEPTIRLTRAADYLNFTGTRQYVTVPLRQAAWLCSDVLHLLPVLRGLRGNKTPATMTFDPRLPSIYVRLNAGMVTPGDTVCTLDTRTRNAWAVWFSSGMSVDDFLDSDLSVLIDETAEGASQASTALLNKHQALAERYVAIRSEIGRMRATDATKGVPAH